MSYESLTTRGMIGSVIVVAIVFAACGSPVTEAEPLPTDDAALARGEELYQASCAECHGTDLRGTDRGPSHLSAVYVPGHHADGAFWLAVLRGVPQHHWRFGDMPPIEGLTEEDVAMITAFVRTVQEREGFEPYPP